MYNNNNNQLYKNHYNYNTETISINKKILAMTIMFTGLCFYYSIYYVIYT